MATVETTTYNSPATALTITLASLATSSTFLAGRESTQIDNTSTKYLDALLQGFITVGTTPTINTQINVYVWGSNNDITSTNLDTLDGADSNETLTNAGILYAMLKLAASIPVPATTSDVKYYFADLSVAQLFGGVLPAYWGVFVAHNTGVNLNSTGGNHVLQFTGITLTAT